MVRICPLSEAKRTTEKKTDIQLKSNFLLKTDSFNKNPRGINKNIAFLSMPLSDREELSRNKKPKQANKNGDANKINFFHWKGFSKF